MPDSTCEGISVVILAFNEAQSLEGVVREIDAELARIGPAYEIVIVDDGSTDGTGAAADRIAAGNPAVRALHHAVNQGLGGVYRTGFREARCACVTFFPADGQFPASIIGQFAPLMRDHDMVLGYLPQSNRSLVARTLSLGERMLYRLLFGKIPRFQGVFMFRRALLSEIELRSTGRGWAILMEFHIKAARRGCRYVSVPTSIRARRHGQSKVNNLRTIVANLRQAIGLRRYL